MADRTEASFIDGPHGRLAYVRREGEAPGVVWLGGFKSDMTGTKATYLDAWAQRTGRAFLRFDYSGHGASDGAFEDGCISDWAGDALAAFDALTDGPQVLVGSSMGAWIAAIVALKRRKRVCGAVFIAPAPDFTEALMWPAMSEDAKSRLLKEGRIEEPSDYDEPTVITKKLIEDGRTNLVLGAPIPIDGPVRILQGMADADVPWRHAVRFADTISSDDVILTLSKAGDHRLSAPPDLARLDAALAEVVGG